MSNKTLTTADVIVLGGGPAGLTLAILLARQGFSVIVIERGDYRRKRVGETFGGELAPVLQQLKLWNDFQRVPSMPFCGVSSIWDDEAKLERASIFNPFGDGWHVNRSAFDAQLADNAQRNGVDIRLNMGAIKLFRLQRGWSVTTATGATLSARFLVDASGRGARASVTSIPENQWLQMDRMIAMSGIFKLPAGGTELILELEAVAEGWWYSAPQPNNKLIVTLITDADLLSSPANTASLSAVFQHHLAHAEHTLRRCNTAILESPPWIVRADSGVLRARCADNWFAIGDAAMGCDPLAGDGVIRAIRSAIEAATLIETQLKAQSSESAYFISVGQENALRQRFLDYLELRANYYLKNLRFPNSLFWIRRQPIDWRAAPLFLDPEQVLQWPGAMPVRELIAPTESLLPPHAIRILLRQLRKPMPAHAALEILRSQTIFEDRRLLVGLQDMVVRG